MNNGTKCQMPLLGEIRKDGAYCECDKKHGQRKFDSEGRVSGKVSVARYRVSTKPKVTEMLNIKTLQGESFNFHPDKVLIFAAHTEFNKTEPLSISEYENLRVAPLTYEMELINPDKYSHFQDKFVIIFDKDNETFDLGKLSFHKSVFPGKVHAQMLICGDCVRKPLNVERYEFYRFEFQEFAGKTY